MTVESWLDWDVDCVVEEGRDVEDCPGQPDSVQADGDGKDGGSVVEVTAVLSVIVIACVCGPSGSTVSPPSSGLLQVAITEEINSPPEVAHTPCTFTAPPGVFSGVVDTLWIRCVQAESRNACTKTEPVEQSAISIDGADGTAVQFPTGTKLDEK